MGPLGSLFAPDNDQGYRWRSHAQPWRPERYSPTIPRVLIDQLKDVIRYKIVEAEDNVDVAMFLVEWAFKTPFYLAFYLLMALFTLFVYVPLWYLGGAVRWAFSRI